VNLYGFVGNQATNSWDLFGLDFEVPLDMDMDAFLGERGREPKELVGFGELERAWDKVAEFFEWWRTEGPDFLAGGDFLGENIPPGGESGALDNALRVNDPERLERAKCMAKCFGIYYVKILIPAKVSTDGADELAKRNADAKKPRVPMKNPSGDRTSHSRLWGAKLDKFFGLGKNAKGRTVKGPFEKAGRWVGRRGAGIAVRGVAVVGVIAGAYTAYPEFDCCMKKCAKEHPMVIPN
jgi:hypothetical protein